MLKAVYFGTKGRFSKLLMPAISLLACCFALVGKNHAASASLPVMSMSLSPGLIHPNGHLYLWGINFGGQLGINDLDDAHLPQRVPLPAGETGWKQVASGTGFTLAIATSGRLYGWGLNSDGPTGLGVVEGNQLTPALVSQPAGTATWLAVAAGELHSLGITDDGELYAWGDNSLGQLGLGSFGGSYSLPVKLARPLGVSRWTAFAAGANFSAALGNNNVLYLWGMDLYDDPDVFGISKTHTPQPVTFPAGVSAWTAISTGRLHIMALGNDGQLYAWGNNSDGQLAQPVESPFNYAQPRLIPLPDGVAGWGQINCGSWHSLALTTSGELYAWGQNKGGRLGLGHTNQVVTPTLVAGLPAGVQWLQIAGGNMNNLGLTSDGNCYVWGDGRYGGIGNASLNDQWTPVRMAAFGDLRVSTSKNPFVLYNSRLRPDGVREFYVTCADPGSFEILSSTTLNTWQSRGSGPLIRGFRVILDNATPAPAKIFWRVRSTP